MPMSPRMKAKKGRFGFAGLAPLVKITSPVTGYSVASSGSPASASVAVTATAYDDKQGDISANIVWTSSIDGVVGVGSPPVGGGSTTLTLSVGTHTITATAASTGSPTSSGSDSITVVVS